LPGVDDGDAGGAEWFRVAGGNGESMHCGDGGNLAVGC